MIKQVFIAVCNSCNSKLIANGKEMYFPSIKDLAEVARKNGWKVYNNNCTCPNHKKGDLK